MHFRPPHLISTALWMALHIQAVTIALYQTEGCLGDFVELPDGDDDACFDIDLDTCCGMVNSGGESVTATFGAVTNPVGANLVAYSQQGDPAEDPCAVFLQQTAMDQDITKYVCLSIDAGTLTGAKVIASTENVAIKREPSFAEPDGYVTVVNETIFGIRKDSAVGEKYRKLKTRKEKRAFVLEHAERAEPIHLRL
ncbi:hypothetical protein BOTNAR_0897g00030 [Botryotinia narcissicola]|uniref:Uncharacterized protein n=1 Tax=Botryotinia narcissicola TaxID=278944 RepID=A0A4Z1H4X6_9HELO|nr:hypothetical protein BOTNAR_0897g00030 [Botryotinia narcissicola]